MMTAAPLSQQWQEFNGTDTNTYLGSKQTCLLHAGHHEMVTAAAQSWGGLDAPRPMQDTKAVLLQPLTSLPQAWGHAHRLTDRQPREKPPQCLLHLSTTRQGVGPGVQQVRVYLCRCRCCLLSGSTAFQGWFNYFLLTWKCKWPRVT